MRILPLLKTRSEIAAALLCGAVLWLVGCKTLEQIAPTPNDAMATTVGGSLDGLHRGRAIYLNQCASCHVAEPVRDYSAAQWEKILPAMNKASSLTPAQASDVKAYIDAVLALPPLTPAESG